MKKISASIMILFLCAAMVFLSGCPYKPTTNPSQTSQTTSPATTAPTSTEPVPTRKPAIYLYPEQTMQVRVKLAYQGQLTCTYPEYKDGWQVLAHPDGTLINQADGREYAYLYWEGLAEPAFDFTSGFVIKGEDTRAFLQEKLAYLGLTPREYNEFIVYWLPEMQSNPYNLITFQGEAYTQLAGLSVDPAPDSLLRVFMAYKPLQHAIKIEEPILQPGVRQGFTVVEWGGSCVP